MKSAEEYKKLSIKEFAKSAKHYDSENAGVYEMCKNDYLPISNLFGHGDVKVHSNDEVRKMCEKSGLVVEKLEEQKGHRMHLVARKKF